MNITNIFYTFHNNSVVVESPLKIVKETDKCYFTKKSRYLKADIGKPVIKYPTNYSYVHLAMVDADEDTLRRELSKWFTDKANQIVDRTV